MENVVSVHNLKKTFDKNPVISGITFDVFRGGRYLVFWGGPTVPAKPPR